MLRRRSLNKSVIGLSGRRSAILSVLFFCHDDARVFLALLLGCFDGARFVIHVHVALSLTFSISSFRRSCKVSVVACLRMTLKALEKNRELGLTCELGLNPPGARTRAEPREKVHLMPAAGEENFAPRPESSAKMTGSRMAFASRG